jgi:hypothetical protein
MHLAQANIALGRGRITDPVMQSFMAQIDEINAVADRSPGFVWRLQTDDGDATSIRLFDEPRMIVNMSVWESIDALFDYVYRSDHIRVLRSRKEWFEPLEGPSIVLWWLPIGTVPDVTEIPRRLELLATHGSTPEAFSLRELMDSSGNPLAAPKRKAS